MVSLIIDDQQFIYSTNNLSEIYLTIVSLPDWFLTEEILHRILIIEARLYVIRIIDAMNIGQEDIARIRYDTDFILYMECRLEILSPIPSHISIVWEDRIGEKYPKSIEISTDTIEYDDIRSYHEEVASE